MALWLNIIWASIQLALFVLQKIKENQLIAQGSADALKDMLDQSNVLIQQIQLDRKSASPAPVPGMAVPVDPFDRDNDPKPPDISPDSMPVVLPGEVQLDPGQPADTNPGQAQQPDVDKPGV